MASCLSISRGLKALFSFLIAVGYSLSCFSQDTTESTYVTTAERLWYLETPVWIAGAVIVLILLMILFRRGGSRSNKNEKLVDGKFTVKRIKKRKTNL